MSSAFLAFLLNAVAAALNVAVYVSHGFPACLGIAVFSGLICAYYLVLAGRGET